MKWNFLLVLLFIFWNLDERPVIGQDPLISCAQSSLQIEIQASLSPHP
jgi:hypothetical protein